MEIRDLFLVALMPVLKTLLIAIVGLFLALDRVSILSAPARHHLNHLVFYIFFPALQASNLIDSMTATNIVSLWFIPVSILITFIVGSLLGWILVKVTRTPRELHGLVIGCCAAGNMGNLPVIIIPSICDEKNNPFGDSSTCLKNGMSYVSLSMGIGAIFVWSYVYNIVRACGNNDNISSDTKVECGISEKHHDETSKITFDEHDEVRIELLNRSTREDKLPVFTKIKQRVKTFMENIELRMILRPPTIATIAGIIIGVTSPIRNIMVGESAPLRFVESSVFLLGDAAIPSMTLIMGANLFRGFRRSGVGLWLLIGIIIVRFIVLPVLGVIVIKAARNLGLVGSDPLYHFVLLLQYSVPPAMAIGTITQLFEIGETESSVIMFWNYAVASVALTLWSTYYMWLLS